jgi:hypothetical protein
MDKGKETVAPVVGKNVIPFSCLLVSTGIGLIGAGIHFVLPLLTKRERLFSWAPVVLASQRWKTVARSFRR